MISAGYKLILAFVTLVIGLVLIGQVASIGLAKTTLSAVTSESISIAPARLAAGAINTTYPFTVAQAPTGWKASDSQCNIQGTSYGNTTTTWTTTTDYTLSTAGVLLLKNTVAVNGSVTNSTLISYKYCPDDYMSQGWSRNVLDLIPGFIALALMIFSVALFYSVGKEYGLIGK